MNLDQLLLDADSHDVFLKKLMGSIINCTKASNVLSKGLDFQINQSYDAHQSEVNTTSSYTQEIIQKLLDFCKIPESQGADLPDDIADPVYYDRIVDAVDELLDRADRLLDAKSHDSNFSDIVKSVAKLDKDRILFDNTLNVRKPQLDWEGTIDNNRLAPFRPLIIRKYHAKVDYVEEKESVDYNDSSLAGFNAYEEEEGLVGSDGYNAWSSMGGSVIGPDFCYKHPYERELIDLAFPEHVFTLPKEILHPTEKDREFLVVKNEKDMRAMIAHLSSSPEIAIDLEHHSLRTFQGLTCLMQLSSRQKDFIVDPFLCRQHMHLLGEVFANPSILKVIHGSTHDLMWLQRDFSLYIVGLFDTYDAAKVLHTNFSYAHLVYTYLHIHLDKSYQLADWRQRPLPSEMTRYARSDTLYLLTVYDYLRRDLAVKYEGPMGIEEVLLKGRRRCLVRYEKPLFKPTGYKHIYENFMKHKASNSEGLSYIQDRVFSALFDWRDAKARELDESPIYLMSNSELLSLVLSLPTNLTATQVPGLLDKWLASQPVTTYTRTHRAEVEDVVSRVVQGELTVGGVGGVVLSGQLDGINKLSGSGGGVRRSGDKSELRNSRGSAMSGSKERLNTVYTATPQKETTAEATIQESPVLETAEMFQSAGWRSPEPPLRDQGGRWSPLVFDAIKRDGISEEKRLRILQSLGEVSRFLDPDLNHLLDAAAPASSHADNATPSTSVHSSLELDGIEGEVEVGGITGDGGLDDLPKSLQEIYKLSAKNKKKRKGGNATVVAEEALEKDKGFDVQEYFKEAGVDGDAGMDTGVESTLAFVKDLGWIGDAEASQLRKEQEEDNALRASGGSLGAASAGGTSNAAMRRSFEKQANPPHHASQKLYASHDFARGSGGGGKSHGAGFDYSKVTNAQHISALPSAPSSTASGVGGPGGQAGRGPRDGRGGRGGGKNRNNLPPPANPYFAFGGGNKK